VIDAQIFHLKKNRLRGDNATRWSSAFLLLTCFQKAYKKGIFTQTNPCTVSQAEIEFYIELLLPAYRFTLLHQRNKAQIGEVIPSVNLIIKKYEQFAKNDKKKKPFCEALIKHIKIKFDYELNSNIYAVAAYLDSTQISEWSNKSFATELKQKARNALPDIANEMLLTRDESVSVASTPKDLTQKSENENLFSNYFDLSDSDSDIAPDMSNKMIKLKEEIDRYNIIVNNPVKEKTSKIFWQNNAKAMLLLNELALTLLNIPSSSSFIERFFSVCGIVNRQRAGNMNDSTLINRAFLKANLDILDKIND